MVRWWTWRKPTVASMLGRCDYWPGRFTSGFRGTLCPAIFVQVTGVVLTIRVAQLC